MTGDHDDDGGKVFFRGAEVSALKLDQAYLNVSTAYLRDPAYVYRRNGNCDGCPFQRVGKVGRKSKSQLLAKP